MILSETKKVKIKKSNGDSIEITKNTTLKDTIQINIRLPRKTVEKIDTLSIIAGKKRPKFLQDTLISFVKDQFPVMIWHPATRKHQNLGIALEYGVINRESNTWIACQSKEESEILARELNRAYSG